MTIDFALLHGGGQGSWVWDEMIAALMSQSGNGVRTLALDVPGCGTKRDRATSGITFDSIVDELVADVEAAGMRDVVLVGHSQAGTVLPLMTARRPGLFRRIVHVSTIAPDPGVGVIEMATERIARDRPVEVNRSFEPGSQTPEQRNATRFCNDMPDDMARTFLARLGGDSWPRSAYDMADWDYSLPPACAVSYVMCLRDAVLVPMWQERFAARFGAGNVVRIDAGHQAMNSRPQALAEILLAEARRS